MAKPIWIRWGFAIFFSEGDILPNGLRTVILTCRHRGGHVDERVGHYPIDGVRAKAFRMNALQGTVSSNTYAQKDMLKNYWGIVIKGMDNDGNSATQFLQDGSPQVEILNGLLATHRDKSIAKGYPPESIEKFRRDFWGIWKCTGMADLPADKFADAKDRLEKAIERLKK